MSKPNDRLSWMANPWLRLFPVIVVFTLSAATTYIVARVQKADENEALSLQFRLDAEAFQTSIEQTMRSYGQELRGGVGLFHASDAVTRDQWRRYVDSKKFTEFAPGMQGLSFNAAIRGPAQLSALEASVAASGIPDFQVNPPGERDFYAPVLFLEPLNDENRRAIGFDIYSEPRRRAAIDTALSSGEITMTAPITLIQDTTNDVQSGVLVVLPTYKIKAIPPSAQARRALADGFVVSVFRIGSLIGSVLETQDFGMLARTNLYLIDTTGPDGGAVMYHRIQEDGAGAARFSHKQTFDLFGRSWTLHATMSATAAAEFDAGRSAFTILSGLAASVLLAGITLMVILRNSTIIAAKQVAEANALHVQTLMQEVNHRSKNLLQMVRAIARLTASTDREQFNIEFSKRIEGLAASQDLLVRNNWHGTGMHDLVHSQLSHFDGLARDRISANGADFDLRPQAAQSIGMALHEMATNAGKHGALSNDVGKIDISWTVGPNEVGQEELRMDWVESGGPEVTEAGQTGFGSAVFGSMVEHGLGGKTDARFDPDGFKWTLTCPTARAREGAAPVRKKPY